MAEKILVADDSLTIQKVISITLANSGYELTECLNEVDLLKMLQANSYDLVLLDFNLSDSKSGYELSKEIKKVSSSTQILAMLGTFDSVDDSELNDCGVGDKIVKPFESEKFIQKCRSLFDSRGELTEVNLDSNSTFSEEISEVEEETDIGSEWVVDSPKPADESSATLLESDQVPDEFTFDGDQAKDALSEEMKGWGIEVPGVIGSETKFDLLPPKIESESNVEEEPALNVSQEDLEYPDMGSSSESLESVTFEHTDLVEENMDEEEDLDATDPSFQMPEDFSNDSSSSLEDEIDNDDFWAVDEVDETPFEEDVNSFETTTPVSVATAEVDELEDIAESEVDQIFSDLESEIDSEKESYSVEELVASSTSTPAAQVNFDSDELVAEVKEAITPVLEDLVKKFCKEKIEQVAWEVIPDLAENLIKKEIKEISSSLNN